MITGKPLGPCSSMFIEICDCTTKQVHESIGSQVSQAKSLQLLAVTPTFKHTYIHIYKAFLLILSSTGIILIVAVTVCVIAYNFEL